MDQENQFMYTTWTNIFAKQDMEGNTIGTVTGFPGHMGDCTFNAEDGKVYATVWIPKNPYDYTYTQEDHYLLAIIDVDKINQVGMKFNEGDVMRFVRLSNLEAYNRSGQYGLGGVDGCTFGPQFGTTTGPNLLTIAANFPMDLTRTDNDYQMLWQYEWTNIWENARAFDGTLADLPTWAPTPLDEYFMYTGNGDWGIQTMEYDSYNQLWFFNLYDVHRQGFTSYNLHVVSAASAPVEEEIKGQPTTTTGKVLKQIEKGEHDETNGIWSFAYYEACTGLESLGDGYFYVCESLERNATTNNYGAKVYKVTWTGEGRGFERVYE